MDSQVQINRQAQQQDDDEDRSGTLGREFAPSTRVAAAPCPMCPVKFLLRTNLEMQRNVDRSGNQWARSPFRTEHRLSSVNPPVTLEPHTDSYDGPPSAPRILWRRGTSDCDYRRAALPAHRARF